jgi:hypothetical protein
VLPHNLIRGVIAMSRLKLLVPAALVAVFAIGCAPNKEDIEKSIREEMKAGRGVEITSIDLTKQSDGGYTGTATATNGDVYDVTTKPPKGSRLEWKAVPSQPVVERILREMMDKDFLEKELAISVASLTLTKESSEKYSGTAVLSNGQKVAVTAVWEGANLQAEWKLSR